MTQCFRQQWQESQIRSNRANIHFVDRFRVLLCQGYKTSETLQNTNIETLKLLIELWFIIVVNYCKWPLPMSCHTSKPCLFKNRTEHYKKSNHYYQNSSIENEIKINREINTWQLNCQMDVNYPTGYHSFGHQHFWQSVIRDLKYNLFLSTVLEKKQQQGVSTKVESCICPYGVYWRANFNGAMCKK